MTAKKRRPGRPRSKDKTDHVVAFRLTSAEITAAFAKAKRECHQGVHAYAKALLMAAVGK